MPRKTPKPEAVQSACSLGAKADGAIASQLDGIPAMRRFTIFGSRLLFWLLAPWVAGGLLVFPYMAHYEFSAHEPFGVVVAIILLAWCISLLLMAISPQRFGWLILFISGSISVGYMWYFLADIALPA